MNKLEIIRKDLAGLGLKTTAVLIVLATLYKLITLTAGNVSIVIYVIGNVLAIAIWTARDILIIDFAKQEIKEGFSIVGLRYSAGSRFTGLEKIFINRVNTSQTMNQQTRSMTIYYDQYKAFLKTEDGEKFWIGVDDDKNELIAKLNDINKTIRVPIYDQTLNDAIRVDNLQD